MSEVDFKTIAISCARRGMTMAEAAAVFGLPRCPRRPPASSRTRNAFCAAAATWCLTPVSRADPRA